MCKRLVVGIRWCLSLFLLTNFATAETPEQFITHFDTLLSRYWHPVVSVNGIETTVFDYGAMQRDAKSADSLFAKARASLAVVDPTTIEDAELAKAFWINAYNFGAMQLVVNHYPVSSIRSFKISLLKHPWSKEVVDIGGRMYSLKEIEKNILLKSYDDIRILFAVSCAAISCPDRTAEAFTPDNLDHQLDQIIRIFFTNDHKGFALDKAAGTVTLSWILEKDRSHFVGAEAGEEALLDYVMPYLQVDEREWLQNNRVKVGFFEHDWTLNDIAQAD